MTLEQTISVNQFGQSLIDIEHLLKMFESFEINYKRDFLNGLLDLILQSKVGNTDIEAAIENSKLKPTFTPCVLIKKGTDDYNLRVMVKLRENELEKVFKLLMALFKIAYKRRFDLETVLGDKWWYLDLSKKKNIDMIKRNQQ